MKRIVFDASLCNGCYGCQFACKDEHCGNDWRPIAAEQPTSGQFWCKIEEEERGSVPEVRVQYTPLFCGHCEDAPCLAAGEADGSVYRREDGLIIIDPEKAKGRRDLVDSCPAGRIYWNEILDIPQKCTGCAHLLDDGWSVPRCVDVCPTGALTYVEEDEVPEGAKPLDCLAEVGSHALYLNMTKRWVYGCLVNREENEVLIGTPVKLVDGEGGEVAALETDEFGEFRFKNLDNGAYTVLAQADGFAPVELAADIEDKDVVLGDIFVKKA